MIIKIRNDWYNYFIAPIWVAKKAWAAIDREKIMDVVGWILVGLWFGGAFASLIYFIHLLFTGHFFFGLTLAWLASGFLWFVAEFMDNNLDCVQ